MTFDEWFEEAWRCGEIDAEYKYDVKNVAAAAWNAALNAAPADVPAREDGTGKPTTGCDAPRVVTAHPLGDERKARPSGEFHAAAGEGVKNSPSTTLRDAACDDIPHGEGK